MPRKRKAIVDDDDDNDIDHVASNDENLMSPANAASSQVRRMKQQQQNQVDQEEDDLDDSDDEEEETQSSSSQGIVFSSQIPEMSQDLPPVRGAERNNLNKLDAPAREKVIQDVTRLVLFKGLRGEAIDRAKCVKEAGSISNNNNTIHMDTSRITSAVFNQANERLRNMFGLELRRMPAWMENIKGLPSKYKDRYYLINALHDDASGEHSKTIHSVHENASIEKGLLMVVLALAYCKGDPKGDGSRWILDKDLYMLLHCLDDNIPCDPPNAERKTHSQQPRVQSQKGSSGVAATPDIDALLQKFVHRDYLIKAKATEEQIMDASQAAEQGSVYYAMGPRAAMEIGRKQVIYFCAEILDEEPDPSMLLELEDQNEQESLPTDEL